MMINAGKSLVDSIVIDNTLTKITPVHEVGQSIPRPTHHRYHRLFASAFPWRMRDQIVQVSLKDMNIHNISQAA